MARAGQLDAVSRGSGIERTLEILQRCSRLDFLGTPFLGDAKKVFCAK